MCELGQGEPQIPNLISSSLPHPSSSSLPHPSSSSLPHTSSSSLPHTSSSSPQRNSSPSSRKRPFFLSDGGVNEEPLELEGGGSGGLDVTGVVENEGEDSHCFSVFEANL
ncbi:unnamed protein product [Lupinus luteus]|uniref:Uncharacterized protein n=1 Tax=Lupinus luteus TaxID=3873 RepID=A0AAV1XYC3_LUPLU